MGDNSSPAKSGPGRDSICRTCGGVFHTQSLYRHSYCSEQCRTEGKAIIHHDFAKMNREHLNAYEKKWRLSKWGKSNREIGKAAEVFVLDRLLPSLGFADIFYASATRRFLPFDFVATYGNRRVLIDVTTKMRKGGGYNQTGITIAKALQLPLLRVFIKPDFTGYMIRDASKGGGVILGKVKPLSE